MLLPWKHVREGHSDLDVCKLLREAIPNIHTVLENPAEELKMHFYFDFASNQNIHFLLM